MVTLIEQSIGKFKAPLSTKSANVAASGGPDTVSAVFVTHPKLHCACGINHSHVGPEPVGVVGEDAVETIRLQDANVIYLKQNRCVLCSTGVRDVLCF